MLIKCHLKTESNTAVIYSDFTFFTPLKDLISFLQRHTSRSHDKILHLGHHLQTLKKKISKKVFDEPFYDQRFMFKNLVPFVKQVPPTSLSGRSCSSSFRKSMSRDEMMPTRRPPICPLSVMGMPQKPCRAFAWKTSFTCSLGLITTGSVMKPCSYLWETPRAEEEKQGMEESVKDEGKEMESLHWEIF